MSRKLLVFLTDPLTTFLKKGEIRTRYYNPDNFFTEIHFLSPGATEVDPREVQLLAGKAEIHVYPLGKLYHTASWFPFGPIASLIRRIRPDVVRSYDPGIRGSLAVMTADRMGIPSLVSVHADLDEQRKVERRTVHYARLPFEQYALSRATAVMCVSQHAARYASRNGAANPVVIHNRVYAAEFEPVKAETRAARDGPLTILSVGRLARQKYQECLIRAVAGQDFNLLLIGDGPLRSYLMQLAVDLGVESRVTFLPAVDHLSIPRYYQKADIFAIATHYEGFCIPVLEAMASGLPVVASRLGPIEEIVADTGILVDNDPQSFRRAFLRLKSDPQFRSDLGRRAHERSRSLDGAVMEAREADLYRSLIAR